MIQGLANANSDEERFVVIGADEDQRRFRDVSNIQEFDTATVYQVLDKYLDPLPQFEVFRMLAESGENYVLIVFGSEQPSPIVAAMEGSSGSKIHFRLGDVWVKKGTALCQATRSDLDAMYDKRIRKRVHDEAESRARTRLRQLQEESGSALPQQNPKPNRSLLVGPRSELRSFTEAAIASNDSRTLNMLVEMARERLVEEWDVNEASDNSAPEKPDQWWNEIQMFYRDRFVPSLNVLVELGLQIIKYEASPDCLRPIIKLLIEVFENARHFHRLRGLLVGHAGGLSVARPAYDAYLGIRTLATYAVERERLMYLREFMSKFVRLFSPDDQNPDLVPILFWPFALRGLPDQLGGRNRSFWDDHVHAAWGSYFRTPNRFFAAASQLEFILEFNSYVFVTVEDPQIKRLKGELPTRRFDYEPDFWASRLDDVVPMALRLYEALVVADTLPPEYATDTRAFDAIFRGKTSDARLLILAKFLNHLTSWQADVRRRQFNRFAFTFDWPAPLKQIADEQRDSVKAKNRTPAT